MLCAWLAFALVAPAMAHKASDSYLQIEEGAAGLVLRWDIALRDLDAALELDLDGDGQLTWGEVKTGWPRIEVYAMAHLQIEGCPLRPGERSLERRNDGAYAVLRLAADCHPIGTPVIAYTLFAEVDPTHRGIAKIQQAGRPLALAVLDPTHPPPIRSTVESAPAPASAATPGAPATSAAPAESLASTLGFAKEGIRHILTGYDHVLFLLCLLLPSV
ncbi:MAG TPA: HupE/UreJ family protein, partial [Caldimonas sp.]